MANPYFPLIIGCIIMAVLIGGCSSASTAPDQVIQSVSPVEASTLIEEMGQRPEFIIIDVRRADEFADGHIPSAINIDSNVFLEHIVGLNPDGAYLIYCQRGARSASVCEMMRDAGFIEVYEVEGGLSAWEAAGSYAIGGPIYPWWPQRVGGGRPPGGKGVASAPYTL